MRGNDYMSASSKKKLRKEQNAAAMTEKQQKELKEAKKQIGRASCRERVCLRV